MSPLRHPFAGRFRVRSRVFPAEVIRPRKRSARKGERGRGKSRSEEQDKERDGKRNKQGRGRGINRGDVITEINAALSFRWQPCSLLSREPSSTSRFFHSSSTPPPQSNLRSGERGPVLNFTYPWKLDFTRASGQPLFLLANFDRGTNVLNFFSLRKKVTARTNKYRFFLCLGNIKDSLVERV